MKAKKITEECLLKLGFKQQDNDLFELELLNIKTPEYHNISLWARTERGLVVFLDIYQGKKPQSTSTPLYHIKHIHELKNLYFALTGTEFEIKES